MSATTHFTDRMSDADAVIWNIESDPALRSTILSVWVLDQAPDWERFSSKFERCIAEIPRLRQRVVVDALGLAAPSWEDDPHFDFDFHVRRLAAPGDGSLRALLDLAEPIGMQSFDRDRPLWELYVIDGLAGGRSGMIMKLHHAISDGVGLVRMTKGMIERSREEDAFAGEPLPETPKPHTVSAWERVQQAAIHRLQSRSETARAAAGALGTGLSNLVRDPAGAIQSLADHASSIGRLLAPVTEPMSPIMTERSLSVHYDHLDVPLEELKRAGKAVGCTLNDAFVSAVAGGLRHYHEQSGEPVEALRMNMPINMRSGDKRKQAGNQFAPVRFAVPVAIADPAERMQRIHELVSEQRAEKALPLIQPISAVIGALPGNGAALLSGLMMKAIDFTTSNVPGPSFPVYVSGARIEHMFGFGPLAGGAVNITCFSYDGTIGIGVNVDPAAVRDPALLSECLRKGIDEVLAVV